MKKKITFLIFIVPFICSLSTISRGAAEKNVNNNDNKKNSAAGIIIKSETLNNAADSKMELTMIIMDKRGKKREKKFVRIVKAGENNNDKILIRFLSPPDVKGTSFLTIEHAPGEDEMWVYFASLRKTRKIAVSSSDRKDRFMGSDFTYGDMNRQVADYNYTLLREEKLNEVDCYVIEEIPVDKRVQENDGHTKKIEWISKDKYLLMKTEYYDLQNRLNKIFTASQPFPLEKNKWMMKKYEMHDIPRNHKTFLEIDKIKVNLGIQDNVFNKRYLQRKSWSF